MPDKYLIDVTDARFKIDVNDDVMRFVRVTSPFAHSDVGEVLLALGREIPGASAYCPSYASCAYVVLHTDTSRIFAIAFGQQGLAFRIPPAAQADALADGGVPAEKIGADWVRFAPWGAASEAEVRDRLRRWCRRAFQGR